MNAPPNRTASLLSLPAEIVDQIFSGLDYEGRWCFALSCKSAAKYAIEHSDFLEIPCSTPPSIRKRPPRAFGLNFLGYYNTGNLDSISKSKAYREVMQSLSRGWVDKQLHWCDQCLRFRAFPQRTRDEWYSGRERATTVESMRKGGGWVQDICLSVDGFICWNHFCPPCAQRWWKSPPAKARKSS